LDIPQRFLLKTPLEKNGYRAFFQVTFLVRTCHLPVQPKLIVASNIPFSFWTVTGGTPFLGRPVNTVERQSTSSLNMISHRKGFKKLGLPADQRKALLRSLTTETIRHGRIKTTLIRARAVRKHVDHMIQLGKRGDLHARRQALAWMYDKDLVHSLFEAAPDRYADREGGYCRVLRTVARQGDNAKMAIIELV
jgi:large subunit ribosomal protein L17